MMKYKPHSRKYWIFLFILSFLFLSIIEFSLRVSGVGETYSLTKKIKFNGKSYYKINTEFPSKYFSRISNIPTFHNKLFQAKKDSLTFRIIVFGGSGTYGFKHSLSMNFPNMLETMLNESYPQKNWEVISFAAPALNSYSIADMMKYIHRYKADLILINIGHDEFYGTFGSGSVEQIPGGYYFAKISIALKKYRLYQLLSMGFQKLIGSGEELSGSWMEQITADKAIPYKSEKYLDTRRDFLRNFYSIATAAEKEKIPVMVSNLVSNIGNHAPFASVLNDKEYNPYELWAEFESYISESDSLEIERFLKDLGIWESQSAIYHYCLGKYFELNGEYESAYENLMIAKDEDALPFRGSSDFNQAIENFAAEKHWSFVNMDSVFRTNSKNGIPSGELFLDHIHPNDRGNWLMAHSFFERIKKLNILSGKSEELSNYNEFMTNYSLTEFEKILTRVSVEKLTQSWPFRETNQTIAFSPENFPEKISRDYSEQVYNWEEANNKLVEYYESEGKINEAIRVLKGLYLSNPFDFVPVRKIIDLYGKQKKYEDAILYLKELQKQIKDAQLYLLSGKVLYQMGELKKSLYDLEFAYEYNTKYEILSDKQIEDLDYYIALILSKTNQIERAITITDSVLIRNPENDRFQSLRNKLELIQK